MVTGITTSSIKRAVAMDVNVIAFVPQTTKLPRSISVCKAICKNETCTRHFSRLAIRKETTGLAWPNPRLPWQRYHGNGATKVMELAPSAGGSCSQSSCCHGDRLCSSYSYTTTGWHYLHPSPLSLHHPPHPHSELGNHSITTVLLQRLKPGDC